MSVQEIVSGAPTSMVQSAGGAALERCRRALPASDTDVSRVTWPVPEQR